MTDSEVFITYSQLTTHKYSDNAKPRQLILEYMMDLASWYCFFYDEFVVRTRFIIDKRRGYSYFNER